MVSLHLYSKLRGRWEERVGLIATLEADMKRLEEETAEQVAALTIEKEDAIKAARWVSIEKLQISSISLLNLQPSS